MCRDTTWRPSTAAVGETKAALGLTDYKANIFPSILYPTKGTADKFGEVYGKKLDLRDPADRLASIKWMVDEQIRQFESHHYQNLRLAGFYWFTEYVDIEADAAMLREFTDYVRRSVISPSGRRFTAPAASIAGRNATLT